MTVPRRPTTSPWAWIPNAITLARIASMPVIVWLLASDAYLAALWLTVAAALSDGLDGFLARHMGWKSRLGALLDPLADKLLVNALFIGLWLAEALPWWLVALTVLRDLVLSLGAAAWHRRHGAFEVEPSWLGKLTTFAQLALVVLALMALALRLPAGAAVASGAWVVAALTVATGLDYVVRWARKARAKR